MTWRRGWISLFLFTLAMINYIDRVALSVAAKPIAQEFGLSPVREAGTGRCFATLGQSAHCVPCTTLTRLFQAACGRIRRPADAKSVRNTSRWEESRQPLSFPAAKESAVGSRQIW